MGATVEIKLVTGTALNGTLRNVCLESKVLHLDGETRGMRMLCHVDAQMVTSLTLSASKKRKRKPYASKSKRSVGSRSRPRPNAELNSLKLSDCASRLRMPRKIPVVKPQMRKNACGRFRRVKSS